MQRSGDCGLVKRFAFPMLKDKDGICLSSPAEMAQRWVEFFSDELAGIPSSFQQLQHLSESRNLRNLEGQLTPPSLDEVLDVLRCVAHGKAVGPDATPIELIVAGGLPAARLVHALISACWLQRSAPLSWKGGRLLSYS